MILTPPWLALAGAAGLALGSFAVTAGVRMSRFQPVLAGRSHCDACGRTLGYVQTLPIVSYVGLRGACAGCRAAIDPIHLLGEGAGALVVVSAVFAADGWRIAALAALGLLLVAAATVDARVRRLPDVLTAGVAVTALGVAAASGVQTLLAGLTAAVAALALLGALRWVGERLRGEPGLGAGDVKLIAALALWLGAATPWMVVGAAGLGLLGMLVFRPADRRLAFGPAIATSAWAVGLAVEGGLWPTM